MAELFKGMSQSKFLDSLVAETGKNGHELFDYLMDVLKIKNVEITKPTKHVEEDIEENIPNYFRGTKQGFIDWASFYLPQSRIDVLNKWKTSMTPEYLAMLIARDLGAERFTWIHTAKSRKKNGELVDVEVEYVV